MKLKFNPTGTHIHKGILKIRFDLYPDITDKTYTIHYVEKFDRKPSEEELADESKLALIPTHKELTPCLCHFIKVNEGDTLEDIMDYIRQIFDRDTLLELDDALSKSDTNRVGKRMRTKLGNGLPCSDKAVENINKKLKGLEVIV